MTNEMVPAPLGMSMNAASEIVSGDLEQPLSRFVVGIDLGTTNSAVAFVDTQEDDWRIRTFPIAQLVAPGEVECRETLPSFHYEPLPGDVPPGALRLPFGDESPRYAIGVYAREFGRTEPGRMIESAKSWLCHSGVDRRAALLPWHGAPDVQSLSPVDVSARYLRHIREAWDHDHPDERLAEQDVVLTIPASFDEVAREMTVAAARAAALPRVVLIEEPQAAFYSWVHTHRDDWEQHVAAGQKILVCDIGGGTTDFTLIHVRPGEEGKVQFHRVAVGDHLMLGGDNLDLALAHYVECKLVGDGKLEPRQWSVLVPTCRHAKETLLSETAPDEFTIALPGIGVRVIGGGLQVRVRRDEVVDLLIGGFLPMVDLEEKPARRQSGFQEFGLPYAADPAVTRYLAAFLKAHESVAEGTTGSTPAAQRSRGAGFGDDEPESHPARPDIVLFNGGFFASRILRDRLIEVLRSWFTGRSNTMTPLDQSGALGGRVRSEADGPASSGPGLLVGQTRPPTIETAKHPARDDGQWTPQLLKNERLDLAVARGAAFFGMVRRGVGVRIVAGLARTYYIGVEGERREQSALCLIAAGTEPAAEPVEIDRQFAVRTSEPVQFPIYVSGTRLTDQPGDLLPVDDEQMSSLPPIRTVLQSRGKRTGGAVSARLSARLTEIGTLELWCHQVDGPRRWQLQFDVRSSTETDRAAHTGLAEQAGIVEEETIEAVTEILEAVFGTNASEKPDGLPKRVARRINMSRADWPPSLLRSMWGCLMDLEAGRKRSPSHEARWLNLVGFSLRPGFGMAADDWRVEQVWRTIRGKLIHGGPACLAEWRILWRRIAGGLSSGRQQELASNLLALIRQEHRQTTTGRGKGADYATGTHDAAEVWRMLASLELLGQRTRIELGAMILDFLPRPKFVPLRPALMWALGRIGARVPVYGPLNVVVPPSVATDWIERLLQQADPAEAVTALALMQLARRTDDRYRDVPPSVREKVIGQLEQAGAPSHFIELVRERGTLDEEEGGLIFGESLPTGLRLA